jgi:hypothetical protein
MPPALVLAIAIAPGPSPSPSPSPSPIKCCTPGIYSTVISIEFISCQTTVSQNVMCTSLAMLVRMTVLSQQRK